MESNPYISDFAKRLYNLRLKKGVTAREMSLSLGQAHNYINGLETEKSFPSMLNFLYICEYFGITAKEFFDYNNENPYMDDELFREIKKLDDTAVALILGLIKGMRGK